MPQFSSNFLLCLTDHVLTSLNSTSGSDQLVNGILSSTGYDSYDFHFGAIPSSSPTLKAREKLIPQQKLWQDIAQHMHKDNQPVPRCVKLSRQELVNLTRGPSNRDGYHHRRTFEADSNSTGNNNSNMCDVIVFSCGHHGNRQTMEGLIDGRLQEYVAGMTKADGDIMTSVTALYKMKDNPIPLACPTCLLEYLSAESQT